jgi:ribosomal protein S18 acetylase RimI-like enzyme
MATIITSAHAPMLIPEVRTLFREYAASLDIDLTFQHFDHELRSLPGEYAPPGGDVLLAWVGSKIAGCVAMRPLTATICEMKRLYVRPPFRAQGVGRKLAQSIIDRATRSGYQAMRLDTLSSMQPANRLYRDLGFKPIAPYYHNPYDHTAFFELRLGP